MIKHHDQRAQIIFVTAYDEFMRMTYERRIGALDYINKALPDFQARLNQTIEFALNKLSKLNLMKKMTFSYRLGHFIRNVNIDDVLYVETTNFSHKLRLVRVDGDAEFVGDIKQVAAQNPFLTKVSQSYLVNPKNILRIDLHERKITFINQDQIYFSRRFLHVMPQLIAQYNLRERTGAQ